MLLNSSCALIRPNNDQRASGSNVTRKSTSLSGPKSSHNTEPNTSNSVIHHFVQKRSISSGDKSNFFVATFCTILNNLTRDPGGVEFGALGAFGDGSAL